MRLVHLSNSAVMQEAWTEALDYFFGSAMTSKKFQAGQGWVQLIPSPPPICPQSNAFLFKGGVMPLHMCIYIYIYTYIYTYMYICIYIYICLSTYK